MRSTRCADRTRQPPPSRAVADVVARHAHFTRELFQFLAELSFNNDRAWFAANKERYEQHVRAPLLAFITDVQAPLARINRQLVADPRPVGGSMFRIHRDTRFSKDKAPYKTHAAAQFRHRAGADVHAPGLYLHLEPGRCFAGGGIWHPDADPLRAIRQYIHGHPRAWDRLLADSPPLEGDMLARVPAGYAKDHRHATDLRRKDFIVSVAVSDARVCAPGFMDEFLAACRTVNPLVRTLCTALGVPR
ncbi:MAG: DUF2461 domain-containing protein [Deltaproteobacteria bacterium]|nr:DUF2461 domain-containing protein [Deltaproteobacteria bacterium]